MIGAVAASALAIVLAVMALPTIQGEQADVPLRTTESSSEKAESTKEAATTPKTEAKRPIGTATSAPARPRETSSAPVASTPSEKPLPAPSEPARALANDLLYGSEYNFEDPTDGATYFYSSGAPNTPPSGFFANSIRAGRLRTTRYAGDRRYGATFTFLKYTQP